jgi:hypothetical protein
MQHLGQIIFPATGSWVRPICMAGDDYFSILDHVKMLKLKLAFTPKMCVSASLNPLILTTIPRDMCKEITKSDLKTEYYSGFDEDNTGPVYVYLGNSWEVLRSSWDDEES